MQLLSSSSSMQSLSSSLIPVAAWMAMKMVRWWLPVTTLTNYCSKVWGVGGEEGEESKGARRRGAKKRHWWRRRHRLQHVAGRWFGAWTGDGFSSGGLGTWHRRHGGVGRDGGSSSYFLLWKLYLSNVPFIFSSLEIVFVKIPFYISCLKARLYCNLLLWILHLF